MPAKKKKGGKRPAKDATADTGGKSGHVKKKAKTNVGAAPTIQDILEDQLTPIANQYWGPGQTELKAYDAKVIEDIYETELKDSAIVSARLVLLELSSYLENYLWKHFHPTEATFAHIMSIVLMVNEKFRNSLISIWEPFHSNEKNFIALFKRVFELSTKHSSELTIGNKIAVLTFLIHSFQSLEDTTVRQCVLRLTNLRSWRALSSGMLEKQLRSQPHLLEPWKKVRTGKLTLASTFIPDLLNDYYKTLGTITVDSDFKSAEVKAKVLYCERFVEFCIDLNAQLPTRRFVLPLLLDSHFLVRCQMSALYSLARVGDKEGPGKLFVTLLGHLSDYQAFEIDLESGSALSDDELIRNHYEKLEYFQRLVFKHLREQLPHVPLATISDIDKRDTLLSHLSQVDNP